MTLIVHFTDGSQRQWNQVSGGTDFSFALPGLFTVTADPARTLYFPLGIIKLIEIAEAIQ